MKTWGPVTHTKTHTTAAHISVFEVSEDSSLRQDESADATNGGSNSNSDGPAIDNVSDQTLAEEFGGALLSFSPRNSRPISLYDEMIDPVDRALLERQYQFYSQIPRNEMAIATAFIQFLATQYGKSINNPIIRQAVILVDISPTNYAVESTFMRRGRLISALQHRINQRNYVDESDLFATFLFMCHCTTFHDRDGVLTSLRGCLAIMKHLSDRPDSKKAQLQFKSLWPLILLNMSIFRKVNRDSWFEYRRILASCFGTSPINCIQENLRILNLPHESATCHDFFFLSTAPGCFLDLNDELASKMNGYSRQNCLQTARDEFEIVLAWWESSLRRRWYHFFFRADYPLPPFIWALLHDLVELFLSLLYLGAIFSSQHKAKTPAIQHESGAFFTKFLREVWLLETFTRRIEWGIIVSEDLKLDPGIEGLIGEILTTTSADPLLLN